MMERAVRGYHDRRSEDATGVLRRFQRCRTEVLRGEGRGIDASIFLRVALRVWPWPETRLSLGER